MNSNRFFLDFPRFFLDFCTTEEIKVFDLRGPSQCPLPSLSSASIATATDVLVVAAVAASAMVLNVAVEKVKLEEVAVGCMIYFTRLISNENTDFSKMMKMMRMKSYFTTVKSQNPTDRQIDQRT